MKTSTLSILPLTAILCANPVSAMEATQIVVPESSIYHPEYPAGQYFRSFVQYSIPPGGMTSFNEKIRMKAATTSRPYASPPYPGSAWSTPASIGCVYQIGTIVSGCNPNSVTTPPVGGSGAIAIVVVGHYPNALNDLSRFSTQFGLAAPNLTVVYASGTKPFTYPWGWEFEAALDLQWSHAMAPNAKQYLVEASGMTSAALFQAVDKASALVAAAGGGQVSMSWGTSEWSGETAYDSHFTTPNVVYVASSGDSAGTSYPCVSPNVVCVGGTTLRYSSSNNFIQEVAWVSTGGGISSFERIPAYQSSYGISGTMRQVPDVSAAADTNSGGWVYYTPSNTGAGLWTSAGGTSWSAPLFAGIINAAGSKYKSSAAELKAIYTNASTGFADINVGWCGPYSGFTAGQRFDPCTGVGSPLGLIGK